MTTSIRTSIRTTLEDLELARGLVREAGAFWSRTRLRAAIRAALPALTGREASRLVQEALQAEGRIARGLPDPEADLPDLPDPEDDLPECPGVPGEDPTRACMARGNRVEDPDQEGRCPDCSGRAAELALDDAQTELAAEILAAAAAAGWVSTPGRSGRTGWETAASGSRYLRLSSGAARLQVRISDHGECYPPPRGYTGLDVSPDGIGREAVLAVLQDPATAGREELP